MKFITYCKKRPVKSFLIGILFLILLLLYWWLGYQVKREQFSTLIIGIGLLFTTTYILLKNIDNFKVLFCFGILIRIVLLFTTPNFSQDFYRFIWDGQLLLKGINPYAFVPNELILLKDIGFPHKELLHVGMGELSAQHYSNYLPLNQLIFALASFLSFDNLFANILWLRIFIILADIGTLLLAKSLLHTYQISTEALFLYFLNPLILIELTANLHFEGVMIFLFMLAIYGLQKQNLVLSAISYGGSIMFKLLPLMLLPLWIRSENFKKTLWWYFLIASFCVGLWLPFAHDNALNHYLQTLEQWFSNFKFNGGIYALSEFIAKNHFDAKPWIFIKDYGSFHKTITLGFILFLSLYSKKKSAKDITQLALGVLSFYFLLSPTVHPWYLSFLIILCCFTPYRYPLVWSALIYLSYYAYTQPNFKENGSFLSIEYLVVIVYLVFEFLKKSNKLLHFRENKNATTAR